MRREHAQAGQGRLQPGLELQPAGAGGGGEGRPGLRHPGQAGQPAATASPGAGQGGSHGGRNILCSLKPLQVSAHYSLLSI